MSWREMHNFVGAHLGWDEKGFAVMIKVGDRELIPANVEQTCLKCKLKVTRTLKRGNFTDWQGLTATCPVTTPVGTLDEILKKHWYGFVGEAWRYIEFEPFHVQTVYLKDELADLLNDR